MWNTEPRVIRNWTPDPMMAAENFAFVPPMQVCSSQWLQVSDTVISEKQNIVTDLCDFLCDIVSSVFDLRCYDCFLRCWWRMSLLLSRLREVESNQRDLVDGAVLVDVRIRGRAKKAGLHMIKRTCGLEQTALIVVTLVKLFYLV